MARLWLLSDNEKGQLIRTIGWDNYSDMKRWEGIAVTIEPGDMGVCFCVREEGLLPVWDVIKISRDGNYFKAMPYSAEIFSEIDRGNIPRIPSELFNLVIAECRNIDRERTTGITVEYK